MAKKITAKKDLYNCGKCFTKGKTYEITKEVHELHHLMDAYATNDQNEPHKIGLWYKNFTLAE